MIEKLDNQNIDISKKIRSIFQVSYAIEAKILDAIDFPPLKRNLEDFLICKNDFFGFWKNEEIAAVIEIKNNEHFTHLQSLVVDPKYFRQGLAQQLISFVLHHFDSETFIVETGVANEPALKLYEKFGFKEIKQWDTEHGIRKIRFEWKPESSI